MHEPEGPSTPLPGPALRVLVCDDEPVSAALLGDLVRLLGHEAWVFSQPHEAIDAARGRPDAAILDIRMPVLDGFACCAAVLAASPRTVCIATSAWSDQEARHRMRAAGFSHYLPKPVGLQELDQLLRQISAGVEG